MKILGTILFLFYFCTAGAQRLQAVNGLPTNEVYDLHIDSKGYLWIAHDLGLSRYNGVGFEHYSSPDQASFSMTDIVEDKQGRIWVHNFSGQVFYIAEGQMRILSSYPFQKEKFYPRMVLCGDELLVTSHQGLFICNTTNLSSKLIPVPKEHQSGAVSITSMGDQALILFYESKSWYRYSKDKGLDLLENKLPFKPGEGLAGNLQLRSFKDTAFFIINPGGQLQKLLIRNRKVVTADSLLLGDFINTVQVHSSNYYVHTKNGTYINDGTSIKDQNLSDMVIDREGNKWYSSLDKGLLVEFREGSWKKEREIDKDLGPIRFSTKRKGFHLNVYQKGRIEIESNGRWQLDLPKQGGGVEFVNEYRKGHFLVGTSSTSYLIDGYGKKARTMHSSRIVKDIDYHEGTFFLATAFGLGIHPDPDVITDFAAWKETMLKRFGGLNIVPIDSLPTLWLPERCRAVCYDKERKVLLTLFKDGVYELSSKGLQQLKFNDKPLYAGALETRDKKVFIATLTNGLLIRDQNGLRSYVGNEQLKEPIMRMQLTDRYLWLLKSSGISIIDPVSENIVHNTDLPRLRGAEVYHISEWDSLAFFSTTSGLYKVSTRPPSFVNIVDGYFDYMLVNDTLRVTDTRIKLEHNQNDLDLYLSSPNYSEPQAIVFKYRLLGSRNEAWQTTESMQRDIRFASLMPGEYILEIYAIDSETRKRGHIQKLFITIQKPWWNSWWFYGFCAFVFCAFIYVLYRYRLSSLMKMEKMRQNISSDLHDDIGATLSSLTIYSQLAKKSSNNASYLDAIQEHAREVVDKLDDLVWSINPHNDSVDQWLQRMDSFASKLCEAHGIEFSFVHSEDIKKLALPLSIRKNLFLVFKESINNVVKHAQCTKCYVSIRKSNSSLLLRVRDNGRGIPEAAFAGGRNGLKNMEYRALKMKGQKTIQTSEVGTEITLTIPLN